MGKLEERENRRKSVIGSMIERTETLSAVGAGGRAKGRSRAEKENQPVGVTELVRGYSEDCLYAAKER